VGSRARWRGPTGTVAREGICTGKLHADLGTRFVIERRAVYWRLALDGAQMNRLWHEFGDLVTRGDRAGSSCRRCSVDLEVLLPHLGGLCVERVECGPDSVTISARAAYAPTSSRRSKESTCLTGKL
jgi:hypothetical protein